MGKYILMALVVVNLLAFVEWGFSFSVTFLFVGSVLISLVFLFKKVFYKNKYLNLFYKIYRGFVFVFVMSFLIIGGLILLNISVTNNVEKVENVNTVIVLGAKVNGYEVSDTLKGRLDTAIEYYNKNGDVDIIVSGGQGSDELISEALAMKDYLINNGVESDKIIMEDKATTTLENLLFSKIILESMGKADEKVLIVTNDYHLFRSRVIASILGIKNTGLCYESSLSGRLYYMVREYPTMMIDLTRSMLVK